MLVAINTHDGKNDERNARHKDAVNNEFVAKGIDRNKRDGKFQERLENADYGIVLHVLVGVHHGVVRYGHYSKHRAYNKAAVNDLRGKDAGRRYVQNAIEKEPTGNDKSQTDNQSDEEMQHKADIKNTFLLFFVALTLRIRHETLSGTCHCRIQESEHGYGATYDIENTEVGGSKRIEYQTGGIKRNEHRNAHLRIKKTCVLNYTICCRRHAIS